MFGTQLRPNFRKNLTKQQKMNNISMFLDVLTDTTGRIGNISLKSGSNHESKLKVECFTSLGEISLEISDLKIWRF